MSLLSNLLQSTGQHLPTSPVVIQDHTLSAASHCNAAGNKLCMVSKGKLLSVQFPKSITTSLQELSDEPIDWRTKGVIPAAIGRG